jgi:hypothetical protein
LYKWSVPYASPPYQQTWPALAQRKRNRAEKLERQAARSRAEADELMVETNPSIYFSSDSLGLRVKARVACACPTPAKSLRTGVIA